MIVEGVNFYEAECLKMTKEEFIERHEAFFWLDRPVAKRRQMLADAYDMMSPPKPGKKKPASKVDKK